MTRRRLAVVELLVAAIALSAIASVPAGNGSAPLDDPQWPLGTGKVLTFTFHDPGTKYVWLTVTDPQGRQAQVMTPVLVGAGATPTPSPTPPPTSAMLFSEDFDSPLCPP